MYSLDLEVQNLLRFGLDYIRAHPEVLDEIFANFKKDHLKVIYGDKEIDKIKAWINTNNIPVFLAWGLDAQRVPCLSVHLKEAIEDQRRAFFSDHGGLISQPKEARTIIPEFVPDGFDSETGEIDVPDGISLDCVRPGHIICDGKKEEYLITQMTPDGFIVDQSGAPVDSSKVTIKSFIKEEIKKVGHSYFTESVDIGIHGHSDKDTVLWMYYITAWILLRFKAEIEKRCMDLSTFSASDFKRDNQYLGENIFTRWIRLTARTQQTWFEDPLPQVDTLVANVYVEEEDNEDV